VLRTIGLSAKHVNQISEPAVPLVLSSITTVTIATTCHQKGKFKTNLSHDGLNSAHVSVVGIVKSQCLSVIIVGLTFVYNIYFVTIYMQLVDCQLAYCHWPLANSRQPPSANSITASSRHLLSRDPLG